MISCGNGRGSGLGEKVLILDLESGNDYKVFGLIIINRFVCVVFFTGFSFYNLKKGFL